MVGTSGLLKGEEFTMSVASAASSESRENFICIALFATLHFMALV
jgi:hypothetical protein